MQVGILIIDLFWFLSKNYKLFKNKKDGMEVIHQWN